MIAVIIVHIISKIFVDLILITLYCLKMVFFLIYILFKYFSQMSGGVKPNDKVDLTEDIQLLLKCAQVLEGRFGLVVIVHFICGKKNDKIYKRLLTHELYGKGKYNTEIFWKALGAYNTLLILQLVN